MTEWDAVTAAALRARRGDAAAATEFVRSTQVDVWRMVSGLSSRAQADDLTQETYARAFASLHRFSGRSSARTWLLAIARRVCADEIRRAVRDRRGVELQRQAQIGSVAAADPADSVVLNGLLDALDDERRLAFVLTQVVGLSYAEAADVCRCPIGTIRSRVARARSELVDATSGATGAASGS